MNRLGMLYLGAMVGLLLIGFALGAQKLNADNLWLDELYSLSNMGVFAQPYSLPEVVDSLTEHSPNHVPLYFFLGAQWARFVGWSQLPMRYLSLLIRHSVCRLDLSLRGRRARSRDRGAGCHPRDDEWLHPYVLP